MFFTLQAAALTLPLLQSSDSPIQAALERADARLAGILAIPSSERTFDNSVLAIDDLQAQVQLGRSQKLNHQELLAST